MSKEKVNASVTMDANFTISLTEAEARALVSITSYGSDQFIKMFYENLGKHYLEPHEAGLVSLFTAIKKDLPSSIARVDDAKRAFYNIQK
jgi:hypothetical protein